MLIYADTSALVKLVVLEEGSERARAWLGRGGRGICSDLGLAEGYSALARRRRERGLSAQGFADACRNLEKVWEALVTVPVSREIVAGVKGIVTRHALTTNDAIHLVSAMHVRQASPSFTGNFAAADRRLGEAAEAEGMTWLNPLSAARE